MMRVLEPTFTFRLTVKDPYRGAQSGSGVIGADGTLVMAGSGRKYHKPERGQIGCDQLLDAIKAALAKAGVDNVTIDLERFEHT